MIEFLERKLSGLPRNLRVAIIFLIDIFLNVVVILGLVYIIRSFIISPFQVYGPSMCDTLNYIDDRCEHGYGEYIIVNKAVYGNFFGWQAGLPSRGDIIVFRPPQNDKEFYIKRVIGLPGETVKLKDGDVYIINKEHPEGFKLDESYLNNVNQHNTRPYRDQNTVFEVPQNQYFVMGDNRAQSSDSRSCFQESFAAGQSCGNPGITFFLSRDRIEGKAWLVLWPLAKITALGNPKYSN